MPNSSGQDTSWYPSSRSFLNCSSHGLLTLFMGSKFLSSWPLQRLHIHKSHAWICPCVPPTGLETVRTAWSYPLPEGGWTMGIPLANLSWCWVGPLRSDFSWTSLGRQEAYHSSSNPRTFDLVGRHYTNSGGDCKTIKDWWNSFWQTAKQFFFNYFQFHAVEVNHFERLSHTEGKK